MLPVNIIKKIKNKNNLEMKTIHTYEWTLFVYASNTQKHSGQLHANSFNRTNWTMIGKLVNSFGGCILNEVMGF